jgi:hypothetical protein
MTSKTAKVVSMSVYTVLEGEHNEVNALFKALEATPGVTAPKTVIFKKLCLELRSHAIAEQQTVYDRIKEHDRQSKTMVHAEEEHLNINTLLEELEGLEISNPAWSLKLSQLQQAVDHHVKEEESKIFERMRLIFTDEQARDMADDFQKYKHAELKRLKNT